MADKEPYYLERMVETPDSPIGITWTSKPAPLPLPPRPERTEMKPLPAAPAPWDEEGCSRMLPVDRQRRLLEALRADMRDAMGAYLEARNDLRRMVAEVGDVEVFEG